MQQYLDRVMNRAKELGLIKNQLTQLMDITWANMAFDIDWKAWYESEDIDFVHDFLGISGNIDRAHISATHKATAEDFNFFVPRFAR